ncbi:hypothetical protein Q73_13490, partial [Bacillus coahuilensis m2-6]|uniref:O-antigen polysaccharide polymerase Wzy n=1 Tax=Bacillus coahuilensis TaxID=408580 RepID=UPI000799A9D6
ILKKCVIYIIASGKLNKKKSLIVVLVTVIYFIITMILTGDRRYQFTAILALVFSYLKIYNIKFSPIKILTFSLLSILSLNLLKVIRNIRKENLVSLNEFFSSQVQQFFNMSVLYETMAEFGLSFFSVVNVYKYIPEVISYQYGLTFLISLLSVFPVGPWAGDFFNRASYSSYIINPMEGTGVGATLFGDFFVNFGWFGVLISLVFGIIFSKMFDMEKANNSRLSCAKYYSLFYVLITLVRATFAESVRTTIIVYCIPLFLLWVIKSYITKKINQI